VPRAGPAESEPLSHVSVRLDDPERRAGSSNSPYDVDAGFLELHNQLDRVLPPAVVSVEIHAPAEIAAAQPVDLVLHARIVSVPLGNGLALGGQAADGGERGIEPGVGLRVGGDDGGGGRLVVEGVGEAVDAGAQHLHVVVQRQGVRDHGLVVAARGSDHGGLQRDAGLGEVYAHRFARLVHQLDVVDLVCLDVPLHVCLCILGGFELRPR